MTTQEYKDRLKKENKKELIEMLGVAYENANKNYEVQLDTEKVKKLYQKEKNRADMFYIYTLALAMTTILTGILYVIK